MVGAHRVVTGLGIASNLCKDPGRIVTSPG